MEAVLMTSQGASTKDLYTTLFVPKDEFIGWFAHGHQLVAQGNGRLSRNALEVKEDIDEFDILCLELYRGIITERWKIKKDIHELVAGTESPQIAFKYLESVYRTEFNPKFIDEEEEQQDSNTESSTSYVMESFFEERPGDAEERKKDAQFPNESKNESDEKDESVDANTDPDWE